MLLAKHPYHEGRSERAINAVMNVIEISLHRKLYTRAALSRLRESRLEIDERFQNAMAQPLLQPTSLYRGVLSTFQATRTQWRRKKVATKQTIMF